MSDREPEKENQTRKIEEDAMKLAISVGETKKIGSKRTRARPPSNLNEMRIQYPFVQNMHMKIGHAT